MSRKLVMVGALLVGSMMATGCVSQREYDHSVEAEQTWQARLAEVEGQRDAADARARSLATENTNLRNDLAAAQQANAGIGTRAQELENQIRNMSGRLDNVRLSMLDPTTDAALRGLASQYPNLIGYDADRGMLRIASDLTFDSGSDVVKSGATEALQKVAQVLTTSGASYELRIEGHTDAQRMSNQSTINRHGDNRGLSLNRAKAVSESLQRSGVPAERILVAGWGQYRPRVANTASGNTPENRRVEIFLTAPTGASYSGGSDAGWTETPANNNTNKNDDFPVK
ncbi:MAG: OmpA family protein [Phycisphaerales bacterium]